MKKEELPLSHKNNSDILNNDDPDFFAPYSVPAGPRKSKTRGRGGLNNRKKELEEGEKEMEMEISKGEWWLWIGWPSSGHVRSFPERGGSVSWSRPGTLCGATVRVSVSE